MQNRRTTNGRFWVALMASAGILACGGSSGTPAEDADTGGDVPLDASPDGAGDGIEGHDATDVPGDAFEAAEGCFGLSEPCLDYLECCSGICTRGFCSTDTGTCEDPGEECISPSQCCSGLCREETDGTRRCQAAEGCGGEGAACTIAADCCSLRCVGETCRIDDGLCAVTGAACAAAAECCSNRCDGTVCLETTESCLPLGEACGGDDRCCTRQCEEASDGMPRCTGDFACNPFGEVCLTGEDCCTWACDDGYCHDLRNCAVVGETCSGLRRCCSGACAMSPAGTETCQYLSGCRPIGEICLEHSDCCSGECIPGADYPEILRCSHPSGCLGFGEVCFTGSANNCCDGRDRCRMTLAGVMRCHGTDEGDCLADLATCAFSDECCCGLCATNESGAPVCCPGGATCIPDGGECRSDADCCGLLCLDGLCAPGFICVPLGGDCTEDGDCCSEYCDPTRHVCAVIIS